MQGGEKNFSVVGGKKKKKKKTAPQQQGRRELAEKAEKATVVAERKKRESEGRGWASNKPQGTHREKERYFLLENCMRGKYKLTKKKWTIRGRKGASQTLEKCRDGNRGKGKNDFLKGGTQQRKKICPRPAQGGGGS